MALVEGRKRTQSGPISHLGPVLWIMAAAVVFGFSSYLAFRHEPWPGAFGPPLSRRWWSTLSLRAQPELPIYNDSFRAVTNLKDTHTVIAVGGLGAVARSINHGGTWEFPLWTGRSSDVLRDVSFVDDRIGWTVGADGVVVRTDQGGTTGSWTRQDIEVKGHPKLFAVHAISANRVIATGADGVIFLSDEGGRHWKSIPSGTGVDLKSVDFATPQIGLIVGSYGVILRTIDGGNTWSRVDSGVQSALSCVRFQSSQIAWAAGRAGTAIRSADGGMTWSSIETNSSDDFLGLATSSADMVTFVSSGDLVSNINRSHWIHTPNPLNSTLRSATRTQSGGLVSVGNYGGIVVSPGDGTWTPKTMGGRGMLNDVRFTDEQAWIAGGDGGLLRADRRSSMLFEPTLFREGAKWGRFCFSPNGGYGLVVDFNGRILSSQDGGHSWRDLPTQSFPITDCAAVDKTHLWISGEDVWRSRDGGESWEPSKGLPPWPDAIAFQDATHGLVATKDQIFYTEDGGDTWNAASLSGSSLPAAYDADRIIYADSSHAWAVGTNGFLMHSEDGGHSWTVVDTGQVELGDIKFLPDLKHGWIVGMDGVLGVTSTGGLSANDWLFRRVQDHVLQAVSFKDSMNGLAVGWGGTIIQSSDGGESWKVYNRPWWPSGWYYLSWLLVALIAAPAYRRPSPVGAQNRSIANKLVSDRPVEAGEPDALGLSNIAGGVSRFLRNENTVPPLTIAITGAWGSGKSSLMNLLAADLRANRFRPVFFNAWHSQPEQNVLASLLEVIQKKGLPSIATIEGILFRTTLLLRRCRRHWLFVFFIGALLAASAGLLEIRPPWLTSVWGSFIARAPSYIQALASKPNKDAPAWLAFVFSAVTAISFLAKSLQAFGVKPEEILAYISPDGGRAKPYHVRFAEQFHDVATALAPRRLVIFIDDLDRCRSQYVLDTLEAVNFLISSGDCYVVMGFAPDQVKGAVALAFKDIAEDVIKLKPAPAGTRQESKKEQSRQKREDYARQYLFKLVNMEIPVPEVTAQGAKGVLGGQGVEPDSKVEFLAVLRPYVVIAALAAALVLIFSGSQTIANQIESRIEARKVVMTPVNENSASQTTTSKAGPPSQTTSGSLPDRSIRVGQAPQVVPPSTPQPHPIRYLLTFPLMILLASSFVWVLKFRIGTVVHDSERFTLALEHWQPVLSQVFLTPRALKRLLNKIRYLAMLRRVVPPEPTLWSTITKWPRGAKKELTEPNDGLSETALVALAALEEIKDNVGVSGAAECKAAHIREFGDPLDERQRERFLELSQGLIVG